ncbi:MAG TPA: ABC transporter ATP-binding protein [Anaerolineaceae bacterium]|nr:ABC transporter ATP-binding protein [Anaerolineaceae bacterium]
MVEIPSIETSGLGRIYKVRAAQKGEQKQLVALQDINLKVSPGELFGLLGPNGAGKTTLIKILTTLLSPTSGWARVSGIDVSKNPEAVRQRINMVSGGESSGYGLLTLRENLWMFAQFYGIPSGEANQRIKALLDIMGLSDRANTRSAQLSTGLRQKMNIIRGFLTDPEVLFLDEPTLGLDVGAARDVRSFVRDWMNDDPRRTILLTTHYLVEAEELCDRVAIINKGRVLACDSPAALKQNLQKESIFEIHLDTTQPLDAHAFDAIDCLNSVHLQPVDNHTVMEVYLEEEAAVAQVIGRLTEKSARILSLQKREPSLEDVFVKLVGASIEEVENADSPAS